MAQIRKYKSGGTFTYDGTDYLYDDIQDSLRDLAKSSDQRIGLQFGAILEALENGNNLSYDSTTNTLEGNVKWRDLREGQERRLEHNRSAFGNTLDTLFNSKVKHVGEAVRLLKSWRPPVKPIELVDVSANYNITPGIKNGNYNQAQQRLRWAIDNHGKDINWNQGSKERGESIQSYSKETIQELLDAFNDSSWTPDQKEQLKDFGIGFSESEVVETERPDPNPPVDPPTVRTGQHPPVTVYTNPKPPVTSAGENPLVNPVTNPVDIEQTSQVSGISPELQQYIDSLSPTDPEFEYNVETVDGGWWVTPKARVAGEAVNDSIFFPNTIYSRFSNLSEEDLKKELMNAYQIVQKYKHARFFRNMYKKWLKQYGLPEDKWESVIFKPNDTAPVIERYFDHASGTFKWRVMSDNKADTVVPKMNDGGTVGSNNNGIKFNTKPDAILGILDLANAWWTTTKTANRQRSAIKENASLLPPPVKWSIPPFNDQGITAAYNRRIEDTLKPYYNQSSDPFLNYSFQNRQSLYADTLRGERNLALSNLYSQHQDKLQELVQKQRVIDNQLALQNLKMVQQANQVLANVDVSERLTKGQSLQRLIYEMRTKMANDAKRAEQYGTYVAQQNADATYIEKLRDAFAPYMADFNQNIDKYGTDWQKYMETEHPEIAAKLRSEANIGAFEELYASGIGRQSWFKWSLPDFTLKQKPDTEIETKVTKVKRGGKMRSTGDQLMLDSDKATKKAIQKLDEYTYKIILKMLS